MSDILRQVSAIIEERRQASPDDSYVASLHHKGLNRILEKVGEEATEVVLAAKDAALEGDRQALAGEVADLWFHTLVMLSHLDMSIDEVLDCLAGRLGVSGLQEKAARGEDNQ